MAKNTSPVKQLVQSSQLPSHNGALDIDAEKFKAKKAKIEKKRKMIEQ